MAHPFQKADSFNWTWKDQLLTALIVGGLAPLWVPLAIYTETGSWLARHKLVKGDFESAWERCAAHWHERGVLRLPDSHSTNDQFDYHLAISLGRAHRRRADLFLRQLEHPDTLLAGYAFFALTAARPKLKRTEIPSKVIRRRDIVRTVWADLPCDREIGGLMRSHFAQQDFKKRRKFELVYGRGLEWVNSLSIEYEPFHCCGKENLIFLRCRHCENIWVECVACHTWYIDLSDLTRQETVDCERALTPPACPRCLETFDTFEYLQFGVSDDYLPTPEQVHEAGHTHLLSWCLRESFAAEEALS